MAGNFVLLAKTYVVASLLAQQLSPQHKAASYAQTNCNLEVGIAYRTDLLLLQLWDVGL